MYHHFTIIFMSLKVSSYSALFAVRCGALSYSSSNFNVTYVNAPQHTVNNAEYERTFSLAYLSLIIILLPCPILLCFNPQAFIKSIWLPTLTLTVQTTTHTPPTMAGVFNNFKKNKGPNVVGQRASEELWTRTGTFVNKPTRGWLHTEEKVKAGGICYGVRVSVSNVTGICLFPLNCGNSFLHLKQILESFCKNDSNSHKYTTWKYIQLFKIYWQFFAWILIDIHLISNSNANLALLRGD